MPNSEQYCECFLFPGLGNEPDGVSGECVWNTSVVGTENSPSSRILAKEIES